MTQDSVGLGTLFLRTIKSEFGEEKGLEAFLALQEILGKGWGGNVFYQILAGNFSNEIKIVGRTIGTSFEKIKAIKVVRLYSGLGLKEAKDFVEAVVDHGRQQTIRLDDHSKMEIALSELREAGLNVRQ